MKDKKAFILYSDQREIFEKLPNEKAGELIKIIFSYVNDENPKINDLLLDIAFSSIKNALKRDLKKWKTQLEQRKEAGKKSAESRWGNNNEKKRKVTSVKSRARKVTDSVNVNVSVNDSVNVKDIKNNTSKEVEASPQTYGNQDINKILEALKLTIRIDDFKESQKFQRFYGKHFHTLIEKIGREEFRRRLDQVLMDDFKRKNCNSLKYLYGEIKSCLSEQMINRPIAKF